MKGGNCFLMKVTKGTNLQGVQVCWEPHSFKVIYEGNVVWFSLFPFTSSLDAVLSVYRNSKLQKLDILSLDDDYVWSRSRRGQWDKHCQRGVFRGSEAWKVSTQSGLLRKMMLENFGEVGQDGIMVPCIVFLVESCRAAIENMVNCTRLSVAEGAARVKLDFPLVD